MEPQQVRKNPIGKLALLVGGCLAAACGALKHAGDDVLFLFGRKSISQAATHAGERALVQQSAERAAAKWLPGAAHGITKEAPIIPRIAHAPYDVPLPPRVLAAPAHAAVAVEHGAASAVDDVSHAISRSTTIGGKIKDLKDANLPQAVTEVTAKLYYRWELNNAQLRNSDKRWEQRSPPQLEIGRLIEEQRQIEREFEELVKRYG